MSTEAEQEAERKAAEEAKKKAEQDAAANSEMVEKLVKERVDAELKEIKSKLDASYKQRDEALSKVAEAEKQRKEAEIKRLEEEGKHREAAEARLAEANARLAALEKHNRELSRDVAVRDALKSYSFRNDKASDIAFKEVIDVLVQNEQGIWVHKTGISIKEFVDQFAKSEDQSFLFKPIVNSGGGTSSAGPTNTGTGTGAAKGVSLFSLPQSEVLKMAEEGRLPKRG